MASFNAVALTRYVHLKFDKQGIFLGKFSPYEVSKSGAKIFNF